MRSTILMVRGGQRVGWVALALAGCLTKLPGDARAPAPDVAPVMPEALRLVAPATSATVYTHRPRVRWRLAPTHRVVVEFCRDRACADVLTTVETDDTSAVPAVDLPDGSVFWRVREPTGATPPRAWHLLIARGQRRGAAVERAAWASPRWFDVNGDGLGDLIDTRGAIYVHRPSPADAARGAMAFEPYGQLSRVGVSGATNIGDVNGDGHPDIATGDRQWGHGPGVLWIYPGPLEPGISQPALEISGPDGLDAFFGHHASVGSDGEVSARGGDFNDDGYGDIAVGSPGFQEMRGRIHVFLGGPEGVSRVADQTIESPRGLGSRFNALASGDVTGDGVADLLAGAPAENAVDGLAVLYRGGCGGLCRAPAWTARGLPDERLGDSGAIADVAGEGRAAMLVGATNAASNTGCVYLYPATTTGPASSTSVGCGPGPMLQRYYGIALDRGDLDGDGRVDVAVGAGDGEHHALRRIYVSFNTEGGLDARGPVEITPPRADELWFGLAGIVDLDADGFADVVAVARAVTEARPLYIYRGGPTGLSRTPLRVAP